MFCDTALMAREATEVRSVDELTGLIGAGAGPSTCCSGGIVRCPRGRKPARAA